MAQKHYRALVDIPPSVKRGDKVTLTEPPIAEYASKLGPWTDEGETETAGDNNSSALKTGIINPDRNALKAKATELGINFAPNIPTDRLMELLQEAEAKRQVGDGSEGGGEPDGEGEDSGDNEE